MAEDLQQQVLFRYAGKGVRTQILVKINSPLKHLAGEKYLETYMWPYTCILLFFRGDARYKWCCLGPAHLRVFGITPDQAVRRMFKLVQQHVFSWEQVGFDGAFYECPSCGVLANTSLIDARVETVSNPKSDIRYPNIPSGLCNSNTQLDTRAHCPACKSPMWGENENKRMLPMSRVLSPVYHKEDFSKWDADSIENPYDRIVEADLRLQEKLDQCTEWRPSLLNV